MLRGGVVVNVLEEFTARMAQYADASGVVVSDSDPFLIKEIKDALSIPVIAKVRVGHFVEAQILEAVGIEYIEEDEVFGIADENNFIDKRDFGAGFVSGCRDLGEALRRITEGSSAIRIQGDSSGSGDVVETVRRVRKFRGEIRALNGMDEGEILAFSQRINVPYDIVARTKRLGRLPVAQFAAGGIIHPADAALMMKLGCDGVFVGKEIWYCSDPLARLLGIVNSVENHEDATVLDMASRRLDDFRDWLTQEELEALDEEELEE